MANDKNKLPAWMNSRAVGTLGFAASLLTAVVGLGAYIQAAVGGFQDEMHAEFAVLREEFTVLRQEFSVLREEFSVLREEFSVLREEVTVLRKEVAVLREEVKDMRAELNQFRTEVRADIVKLETGQKMLVGQVAELRNDMRRLDDRVRAVEVELATLRSTASVSEEVAALEAGA